MDAIAVAATAHPATVVVENTPEALAAALVAAREAAEQRALVDNVTRMEAKVERARRDLAAAEEALAAARAELEG